jgi:hypothetical protein
MATNSTASKLAGAKAAASCRTPKQCYNLRRFFVTRKASSADLLFKVCVFSESIARRDDSG